MSDEIPEQKHSNNIRKIRKLVNIPPEKLADLLGCSVPHLYNLETGSRPISDQWRDKLVAIFGCKPEDLEKEELDFDITVKYHIKGDHSDIVYRVDDGGNVYNEDGRELVTIPMYDVSASAGSGVLNFNDNIDFRIILSLFNETTGLNLKETDVRKNRFSIIKANGDSMSPYIEDGNLMLIDHDKMAIEHHRQVMVFRDGDNNLFVKEIHMPYTGKLSVISYNDAYRSWVEDDKDRVLEAFGGVINIVGKVLWHGKKTTYFKGGGHA